MRQSRWRTCLTRESTIYGGHVAARRRADRTCDLVRPCVTLCTPSRMRTLRFGEPHASPRRSDDSMRPRQDRPDPRQWVRAVVCRARDTSARADASREHALEVRRRSMHARATDSTLTRDAAQLMLLLLRRRAAIFRFSAASSSSTCTSASRARRAGAPPRARRRARRTRRPGDAPARFELVQRIVDRRRRAMRADRRRSYGADCPMRALASTRAVSAHRDGLANALELRELGLEAWRARRAARASARARRRRCARAAWPRRRRRGLRAPFALSASDGRGVARGHHRPRHLGLALLDLGAQPRELGRVGKRHVARSRASATAEILEVARHRGRRGRGLRGGARGAHAIAGRGLRGGAALVDHAALVAGDGGDDVGDVVGAVGGRARGGAPLNAASSALDSSSRPLRRRSRACAPRARRRRFAAPASVSSIERDQLAADEQHARRRPRAAAARRSRRRRATRAAHRRSRRTACARRPERRDLAAQHGGGLDIAGGIEQERDLIAAVEQRQLERELAGLLGAEARRPRRARPCRASLNRVRSARAILRAGIGERALADRADDEDRDRLRRRRPRARRPRARRPRRTDRHRSAPTRPPGSSSPTTAITGARVLRPDRARRSARAPRADRTRPPHRAG